MKIIRQPRPKGLTELSLQHQSQKTEESFKQLHEHVIRHYVNTNFNYCQTPMSIETFSHYTHTDITLINNIIYNVGQIQYNLIDQNDRESLLGGLIFNCLNGSLSDRSTALQHANILLKQQGDKYVPFLSSEVTKALKLAQDSNAQILNVLSKFVGNSNPINIFNVQNNNIPQGQQGLTVHDALQLINQKPGSLPLLTDTSAKEDLYIEYHLADMPEVNATRQTGYDTAKEGLDILNIAGTQVFEIEHEDEHHVTRREKAYGIDIDADDI